MYWHTVETKISVDIRLYIILMKNCVPLMIVRFSSIVVIGSGGVVLLNTVHRDSEKAKRILGYTFVSGILNLHCFSKAGEVFTENLGGDLRLRCTS